MKCSKNVYIIKINPSSLSIQIQLQPTFFNLYSFATYNFQLIFICNLQFSILIQLRLSPRLQWRNSDELDTTHKGQPIGIETQVGEFR